jgi:cell division septation protein DedD
MSDKTIAAIAAEIEQKQPVQAQANEAAAPEAAAEMYPITLEELESIELPGDLPVDAQPERKEFMITDDRCADWAVRKIKEEKQEYDRIRELGEQQIAEIQEKIDRAKRRFEQNTGFLTSKLAQYFNTVPHKKTKTRETYRLLSGNLVLKLGGVKATLDDEKLVKWLKSNGYTDFVKVEEKPTWGELKKKLNLEAGLATMADTGEIVEGITVVQQPDTFVVD